MAVRQDKFQPGDEVQWTEEFFNLGVDLSDGTEGPFLILTVGDVPYQPGHDAGDQSNWQAMGHTQLVTLDELAGTWSGAFFEKVSPAPDRPINDLSDDSDALASAGFIEEA